MGKNRGMLAGWIPPVAGFSLALLISGGCAQIGPASISHGRAIYNEVIAKTDDDQSLAYIVRLRYGQTANLLTVASITANVRFSANAGAQFGFAPTLVEFDPRANSWQSLFFDLFATQGPFANHSVHKGLSISYGTF